MSYMQCFQDIPRAAEGMVAHGRARACFGASNRTALGVVQFGTSHRVRRLGSSGPWWPTGWGRLVAAVRHAVSCGFALPVESLRPALGRYAETRALSRFVRGRTGQSPKVGQGAPFASGAGKKASGPPS
jgi:hypothetical protein